MKKQLKKILFKLVLMKIYISRTIGWMSIANSVMLVFLVLERLNSLGVIESDLGNSLFIVVISWFCLLVFLGWVEVEKIKAPHVESIKMIELNPPMNYMYKGIGRIEKKLEDLEEEIKEIKKR